LRDEGTVVLCGALRESKVSKVQELDLQSNDIGVAGATAIARLCAVRASLTSCNVLYNEMDVVAAKLLADAVKEKEISLCGIKPDQTTADFNGFRTFSKLNSADAILLASDLSKAGVSAKLTSVWAPAHEPPLIFAVCPCRTLRVCPCSQLDVSNNELGPEGTKQLADAMRKAKRRRKAKALSQSVSE
jgi:hypothetical protein